MQWTAEIPPQTGGSPGCSVGIREIAKVDRGNSRNWEKAEKFNTDLLCIVGNCWYGSCDEPPDTRCCRKDSPLHCNRMLMRCAAGVDPNTWRKIYAVS